MSHTCVLCYSKENDKCLYTKDIINNVKIGEFDKIFNYYINTHNKKFDFYYIDCEFGILFETNCKANIEINYLYNTDFIDIRSYLLFYINSCEIIGYKFNKINHMIIKTISCRCNMSYKYYINQPMSMLERRINFIIARNPKLINSLDCNKNHPLIRKYSHIPFIT